ncbi:serine/threonine-protein kinase [Stigmatella erecta]|uniref:Serine/threonine protein kinase n=1 Tax=Stigmatella erecta TaxID=83460 RepID=A0A1I0GY33_9BACT|nr:serine/threonine-protein kinase [Stigmatella erecta]SET76159.1 serine/threonine protein kinase [Stigmatella erecta]
MVPIRDGHLLPSVQGAGSLSFQEERAFLRQRLVFLYKTLFALSASFFVATAGGSILLNHRPWEAVLLSTGAVAHVLNILGALACWLTCRNASLSIRALKWLEGLALVGLLYLLKVSSYSGGDTYGLLLSTTCAIISRSVFIPTSVRRAFWLSLACALPDAPLMALSLSARGSPQVVQATLDAVLWSAITVTLATLICKTIYGLRQEVRDARRLGQYTLLERLGAGSMGEVFLASHALLRRHTAIKLLRADAGGQELERFEREVQLTSQLTHPNTIAIYDYGRTSDGLFYYAMEYLEGMDLAELIAMAGPQPPERVIHILSQVCGALEEAHGQGMLHRDIKPANLFLCRRRGIPDLVKVLDFGLVKQVGSTEEPGPAEGTVVAGTPLYLSPETVASPGKVDARSDLYSLGAVGYALLTGRHVFEGQSASEICAHHVNTPPTHPEARLGYALPADLCDILLRCLEKQPEARFNSARELRAALEECVHARAWTELEAEQWWAAQKDADLETTLVRNNPLELSGTQTLITADLGDRAA